MTHSSEPGKLRIQIGSFRVGWFARQFGFQFRLATLLLMTASFAVALATLQVRSLGARYVALAVPLFWISRVSCSMRRDPPRGSIDQLLLTVDLFFLLLSAAFIGSGFARLWQETIGW